MRFGVLGPLLVADGDGRWLTLRGNRQRALLAMLLFHANEFVPAERLVGALWPGVPPKSYASNLHTYVSRLRERIGAALIDHASHAYRVRVAEDELDLLVFLAESDLGRRAARTDDPATAAAHFRRALAQWRDHPLADLHLPALAPDIARLETEHLAAVEDCMDAELAIGRHAELVGELQAMAARYPLRERLVGQLMIALQRSGRQAEALDAYRQSRTTLIEETGIEPGAELRRVHALVLRGDTPTPAAAPAWPICQLPADIADFCGRRESIDELTAALREHPLVVLSGEPRHVALALHSLSWSLVVTGEVGEAASLAEEAVALLRSTTARSSLAQSLRTLGVIHAGRGRRALAVAAFEEARTIARELNEHPRELSCTRAIAASWIGDGRAAAAIPELTGCLRDYETMGSAPAATMITLRLLGIAYDTVGDTAAAERVRLRADRLVDARDVSAHTVLRHLTNLTRPN